MTTKHTPGPWIANVWTTGRRTVENGHGLVICEVHDTHDPDGKATNACLIAAAPDLLEALAGLLVWYSALAEPGSCPDGLALSARLHEAANAIARAEEIR